MNISFGKIFQQHCQITVDSSVHILVGSLHCFIWPATCAYICMCCSDKHFTPKSVNGKSEQSIIWLPVGSSVPAAVAHMLLFSFLILHMLQLQKYFPRTFSPRSCHQQEVAQIEMLMFPLFAQRHHINANQFRVSQS